MTGDSPNGEKLVEILGIFSPIYRQSLSKSPFSMSITDKTASALARVGLRFAMLAEGMPCIGSSFPVIIVAASIYLTLSCWWYTQRNNLRLYIKSRGKSLPQLSEFNIPTSTVESTCRSTVVDNLLLWDVYECGWVNPQNYSSWVATTH